MRSVPIPYDDASFIVATGNQVVFAKANAGDGVIMRGQRHRGLLQQIRRVRPYNSGARS